MKRIPLCSTPARSLRAALATALLSLSFGAAVAVPAWDDYVEPTFFEQNFPAGEALAFEQNFPASDLRADSGRPAAELTDNQISEALFLDSEVIELFVLLAGLDPLQVP